MNLPFSLIIRVACGDTGALAKFVRNADQGDIELLAALVLSDPDPHPIAALTALAWFDPPLSPSPAALHAVVRSVMPAALAMLKRDVPSNVRAMIARRLDRVLEALDAEIIPDVIAFIAHHALPHPIVTSVLQALYTCMNLLPPIDTVAPMPTSVADWMDYIMTAPQSAANIAADIMKRIGAAGWRMAPSDARTLLVRSLAGEPDAAVSGSSAVWSALSRDERACIARIVARCEQSTVRLLQSVDANGWASTPLDARNALLNAAIKAFYHTDINDMLASLKNDGLILKPEKKHIIQMRLACENLFFAVLSGGAFWEDLSPEERDCVAMRLARAAFSSADLLARIGAGGVETRI